VVPALAGSGGGRRRRGGGRRLYTIGKAGEEEKEEEKEAEVGADEEGGGFKGDGRGLRLRVLAVAASRGVVQWSVRFREGGEGEEAGVVGFA